MLIEINDPIHQQTRVVMEASQAAIAGRAQQCADGAGRVIVVNAERAPARRSTTYRTESTLLF